VEEESKATRQSLGGLKEEVRNHYKEVEQQFDALENKVKTMERNYEELSKRMYTIFQDACTSLHNPQGGQSAS